MPTVPHARPYALLVAATACWGVGTVLSKQALDRGIAPVALLAVELAASSTFVLVVLAGAGTQHRQVTRGRNYVRVVALGALNPALAYALALLGLVTVSASLAVLIWALEPVVVAVLALLLLRERLSAPVLALTFVAVVGAILVLGGSGASGDVTGIALTIAAVSACGLYTVLTRRLVLDDGSLVVVLGQQVLALILVLVGLAVMALVTGGVALGSRPDAGTASLAVGSGIVYYGLAFVCYVSGLRHLPATAAGAVLPLIPVWGFGAAFIAGDRLSWLQWLGAIVVGASVLAVGFLQTRPSETQNRSPGTASPG